MRRSRHFILGLIVGAVILWIVAVFVHIPKVKSAATAAKQPATTAPSHNQSITTSADQLSGFPSNVPIYSPSSIIWSTKVSGSSGNYYSADYTTSSTPTLVMDYYKTQLNQNGWQITDQSSGALLSDIKASNGKEKLNVLITNPVSTSSLKAGFQLDVVNG